MATVTAPADVVEEALVRIDVEARRQYGPDERTWTGPQLRDYLHNLEAARLDPGWVITR
ncbi:hypothetical protein [Streptomyces sp. bgisy022]|uniref:hypothetical protein n=1 Tax=Streptomyces sp. bgisy022 TaxID=3413769 RepID=UPI003D736E31